MKFEFILYVRDQHRSRNVYAALLALQPVIDVPGMTEFDLAGCKLGLMPEEGIAKIITPALPHPSMGAGIPRCEVYLLVDDLAPFSERAVHAGVQMISAAADRSWGHRVVYFADPDGHVIAFAQKMQA
ncbi:MAG: lactoylglutathione lyase [Flavobacteriales bacterium]|nr:lactoylglutathione lyase [Flavobacteriales bacterium]